MKNALVDSETPPPFIIGKSNQTKDIFVMQPLNPPPLSGSNGGIN